MAKSSEAYWDDENERVGTEKIDRDIHVFINEHGFTGLHLSEGRGMWFDIHKSRTMEMGERDPDIRTFRVVEELISRTHKAGAMVHIWLWGSDGSGRNRSGSEGIGGPMSATEKRLLRYIAARAWPYSRLEHGIRIRPGEMGVYVASGELL